MKTKSAINLFKKTSQQGISPLLQIVKVGDSVMFNGSNLGGLSTRQIRRLSSGKNKSGVSR